MKTRNILSALLLLILFALPVSAQTPEPGPNNPFIGGPGPVIGGSGLNGPVINPDNGPNNGPAPAPGADVYNPGPPAPAPAPGPAPLIPIVVNTPPLSSPNWQNSGVMNVMACGYDAQGVWRTIPLRVAYTYNGAQYDVNVLAAWNPWTDCWNRDLDVPAFNTTYFLNGNTYDFYTNLSTGTFYFNL